MSFNIQNYPNQRFSLFSFSPIFHVNLSMSVRKKLNIGEQLTNATALKILKQIRWESDIASFLTKPIVCVSLSTGLIFASMYISMTGVISFVANIFLGGLFGYCVENSINGFLPAISQAYADQSRLASRHINNLAAATDEMTFTL
jgi:hypothetical protein